MTVMKAFIKQHPVLTYFALTFAISWGGFVLVLGPGGFPGTQDLLETLFPLAILIMLLGPPFAVVRRLTRRQNEQMNKCELLVTYVVMEVSI